METVKRYALAFCVLAILVAPESVIKFARQFSSDSPNISDYSTKIEETQTGKRPRFKRMLVDVLCEGCCTQGQSQKIRDFQSFFAPSVKFWNEFELGVGNGENWSTREDKSVTHAPLAPPISKKLECPRTPTKCNVENVGRDKTPQSEFGVASDCKLPMGASESQLALPPVKYVQGQQLPVSSIIQPSLEKEHISVMPAVHRYGLSVNKGPSQFSSTPNSSSKGTKPNTSKKATKEQKSRRIEDSSDCVELTKYFEKKYNIPDGLLLAIANVESTRRPWAVNNYKESRYFNSLDEAVEYIGHLEKKVQMSISVGFMQVNWMVHKKNFKSIREAFTPFNNVEFAAKLLVSLYLRFGSWERAIMWYNPCGSKPNYEYFKKIRKHCEV